MKLKYSILISFLCFFAVGQNNSFEPGKVWKDTDGVHINAHGGGILYVGDIYYWYGEFKTEGKGGNTALKGVSCYSSKDLYNWHNEGIVLKIEEDSESEITKGCIMERPKWFSIKKQANMSCGFI